MPTKVPANSGQFAPGHRKRGGRSKGTPNKRTVELLQALEAHGCDFAQQVARLLHDPAVEVAIKIAFMEKLLPYLYPQRKAIDPDGYLTVEQAAGMLGAQAVRFREALLRHAPDQALAAQILDELRATKSSNGHSLSAV